MDGIFHKERSPEVNAQKSSGRLSSRQASPQIRRRRSKQVGIPLCGVHAGWAPLKVGRSSSTRCNCRAPVHPPSYEKREVLRVTVQVENDQLTPFRSGNLKVSACESPRMETSWGLNHRSAVKGRRGVRKLRKWKSLRSS